MEHVDQTIQEEAYDQQLMPEKAPLGRRIGAAIIDSLVFMLVFVVSLILALTNNSAGLWTLLFAILAVFLVLGFASVIKGQSIGKYLFGIGVRKQENPLEIPSFGRQFVRIFFGFLWLIDFFLLVSGKVKIGDRLAGTDVYRVPRRKIKPVVFGVVVLLIVVGFALVHNAVQPRTPLSAEEFVAFMEEGGLTVQDMMYQWINIDMVDTELGSVETHFGVTHNWFHMEFSVHSTEARARSVYVYARHNVQAIAIGVSSSHSEVSFSNFNRFTQTANEWYIVVSRIGNTILTVQTHAENRSSMDRLLGDLGY